MHGLSDSQFFEKAGSFLTFYYLMLALMNGVIALYLWRANRLTVWVRTPHWIGKQGSSGKTLEITNASVWLAVAFLLVLLAGFASSGNGAWMPSLPESWRKAINQNTGPEVYTAGTTLGLVALYAFRNFFVVPAVAWTLWNLMWLALGLSMADPNFYAIVSKPDNVPIAAMIFLLTFFTWLATHRAVENDRRLARGEPTLEEIDNEKVLVWPDLVYTELICMIAVSALLIFWAIALKAPLEEAASIAKTPVSSKAPWYFLGLQDMLVYYDPWMAGVVLPGAIVCGLIAIPYLDFNQAGNGYYTIHQRRFSYIVFQYGFLGLWISLILLGTFLRGPFWNFYGPYEFWDSHKIESSVNIYLSNLFWEDLLKTNLPMAPAGSGTPTQLGYIVVREAPGLILVLGYFIYVPFMMATTLLRSFYVRMGLIRFLTMAYLLLLMAALPIKMILVWVWKLKYVIAIPEYFINF